MDNQVELYEGAIFILPKQPPKTQIMGHHLPQKSQKWMRTILPENWDDMSEEEQGLFAFEEDKSVQKVCGFLIMVLLLT